MKLSVSSTLCLLAFASTAAAAELEVDHVAPQRNLTDIEPQSANEITGFLGKFDDKWDFVKGSGERLYCGNAAAAYQVWDNTSTSHTCGWVGKPCLVGSRLVNGSNSVECDKCYSIQYRQQQSRINTLCDNSYCKPYGRTILVKVYGQVGTNDPTTPRFNGNERAWFALCPYTCGTSGNICVQEKKDCKGGITTANYHRAIANTPGSQQNFDWPLEIAYQEVSCITGKAVSSAYAGSGTPGKVGQTKITVTSAASPIAASGLFAAVAAAMSLLL